MMQQLTSVLLFGLSSAAFLSTDESVLVTPATPLTDWAPEILLSMRGVDTSLLTTEKKTIPVAKYLDMMRGYSKEYFARIKPTGNDEQTTVFFKQIGSNMSEEVKSQFSRFHLNFSPINFLDSKTVTMSDRLNFMLQKESNLFNKLMTKPDVPNFDPLNVLKDHLHIMLEGALNRPRNTVNDHRHGSKDKSDAAAYIWKKMGMLGFVTGAQVFKPKQFHQMHDDSGPEGPRGSNMMTVIPGRRWGTRQDKVLVVGAHWDTMPNTPGYDDNASGVSVLLELLRALSMSECQPEFTVVVVAFDLEEYGTQGSLVFVQDFIVGRILEPMGFPGFQGAIILDSVMNFNFSSGSQVFPHDYRVACPQEVSAVEADGSRGDFLAVFARPYEEQLADRIQFHWRRHQEQQAARRTPKRLQNVAKIRRFDLKELGERLPRDDDKLINAANFLRSDHARFWYANHEDFAASFKSVLLTDTGPARGVMMDCYHKPCDSRELNSTTGFANLDALAAVAQTVIDAVVDASAATCKSSNRRVEPMHDEEPDAEYLLDYTKVHQKLKELEEKGFSPPVLDITTSTTRTTTTTATTTTSTTIQTTSTTFSTTTSTASSDNIGETPFYNKALLKNFRPHSHPRQVDDNSLFDKPLSYSTRLLPQPRTKRPKSSGSFLTTKPPWSSPAFPGIVQDFKTPEFGPQSYSSSGESSGDSSRPKQRKRQSLPFGRRNVPRHQAPPPAPISWPPLYSGNYFNWWPRYNSQHFSPYQSTVHRWPQRTAWRLAVPRQVAPSPSFYAPVRQVAVQQASVFPQNNYPNNYQYFYAGK